MNDWKQKHADEAERTLDHQLVIDAMDEFAGNMGFKREGLAEYGLAKVAFYAATVARAQALGFDPDLLRLSSAEGYSVMLEQAAQAVLLGIPTHLLDVETGKL